MIKCVMFLVEMRIVEIQENKIILLNHTQRGFSLCTTNMGKIWEIIRKETSKFLKPACLYVLVARGRLVYSILYIFVLFLNC